MLWLAFTLWLIRATPNGLGIGFGPVVIAHNYAAEINAEALAVPEEERAEPLYAEANLMLQDYDSLRNPNEVRDTTDPEWNKVAEFIRRKQDAIGMIRQAAAKRHLGLVLDDTGDRDSPALFARQGIMYVPEPPSDTPMVANLKYPHVGRSRWLFRCLSFDMRLAGLESDGARVVGDFRAMLGLVRHVRQPPWFMAVQVSHAGAGLALWDLQTVIDRAASSLNDSQLEDLRAMVETIEPVPCDEALAISRTELLDLLQRWYTDDGGRSGRMTYGGYVSLRQLAAGEEPSRHEPERDSWGLPVPVDELEPSWIFRPMFWKSVASRRETLKEYDRLCKLAEVSLQQPMWSWTQAPNAAVEREMDSAAWSRRFSLVGIIMPAFNNFGLSRERLRQARDATLVAIALEQHRRKHGDYPATLAEIDAEFLPTIPPDRFDGQPIKYTLRDGRPLLYSVGVDRDDDGGRPPRPGADPARWRPRPAPEDIGNPKVPQLPDGDWLLWPRAE